MVAQSFGHDLCHLVYDPVSFQSPDPLVHRSRPSTRPISHQHTGCRHGRKRCRHAATGPTDVKSMPARGTRTTHRAGSFVRRVVDPTRDHNTGRLDRLRDMSPTAVYMEPEWRRNRPKRLMDSKVSVILLLYPGGVRWTCNVQVQDAGSDSRVLFNSPCTRIPSTISFGPAVLRFATRFRFHPHPIPLSGHISMPPPSHAVEICASDWLAILPSAFR